MQSALEEMRRVLESAGMDFHRVVFVHDAPPTRTTVQPHSPVERVRHAQGRMPKLEEISVIAVK